MKIIDCAEARFEQKLKQLCRSLEQSVEVANTVTEVINEVREKGDKAVLAYTAKFDQATLKPKDLRVRPEELVEASKQLSRVQKKAIKEAIACVTDFNQKTKPRSWQGANPHGATVGEIFYPIQRVGLYVPGGQVPLVSSVVMSAILAKIAGVPEVVVCTPPQADGSIDPGLLAALHLCGVREVYKVGGIQAIAAMALGTKKIPAVDKVFGPGNAFVMEAKRQLYGVVGVDLLPGPSEVMVIADETAQPAYVAADLLAQAEHGTGKEKIYLIVTDRKLIPLIEEEIKKQTPALSHAEAITKIIAKSFTLFACDTLKDVSHVANLLAPEHMELQVSAQTQKILLKTITTAGAILLGHHTPTVLGDFTAGPSHTLPTARSGRFFSGMQVTDFMRRSSIVKYDKRSAAAAWPTVEVFSKLEKLDAHGNSLRMRVEK